ncbi:MAG: tetratricopeptide repeat-containing glycosyltransferase family protein [Chlamydiota bacterium]
MEAFWNTLGTSFFKEKGYKDAVETFQEGLRRFPNSSQLHCNLAQVYIAQKRYRKALQHLHVAMQQKEPEWIVYFLAGNCHYLSNHFHKAIYFYNQFLSSEFNSPEVLTNLGKAYHKLLNIPKALSYFEKALDIDPSFVKAHIDKGFTNLLIENWEPGWADWEWRFKEFKKLFCKIDPFPYWKNESLENKRLLIASEQGLGDIIQFSRYIRSFPASLHLVVRCPSPIKNLLQKNFPEHEWIFENEETECDYQIPMQSLPHLLKIYNPHDVKISFPYIQTPSKSLLPPSKKLKVGLVWKGNPLHDDDKNRSIPLSSFLPLLEKTKDHIEWYSLQKGEVLSSKIPMINLGERLLEFSETAEAINALDLVISVDTSVAHLAGAMNKPVWVLIPFFPDWRWGLKKETTDWYPSMRLFRQKRRQDWKGPLDMVYRELENQVLLLNECNTTSFIDQKNLR